jgi:hypothetical protein
MNFSTCTLGWLGFDGKFNPQLVLGFTYRVFLKLGKATPKLH